MNMPTRLKAFCIVALLFWTFPAAAAEQSTPIAPLTTKMLTAFDFAFKAPDGKDLPLSAYKGKVVLIVNTATGCGFAGHLNELQQLYTKYTDQGLVVLGVPSNDFGGQEPVSNEAMAETLKNTRGVTFPVTARTAVSGKDAHDFYVWAGKQNAGNLLTNKPRWNFHKYLIGRDGRVLESTGATTNPLDKGFVSKIEAALASKTP
jgi:glutathione peroxidase